MIIRTIVGAIIGGALGYLYAAKIGCSTGTCPITSNKGMSTLYGAILGGFIGNAI